MEYSRQRQETKKGPTKGVGAGYVGRLREQDREDVLCIAPFFNHDCSVCFLFWILHGLFELLRTMARYPGVSPAEPGVCWRQHADCIAKHIEVINTYSSPVEILPVHNLQPGFWSQATSPSLFVHVFPCICVIYRRFFFFFSYSFPVPDLAVLLTINKDII